MAKVPNAVWVVDTVIEEIAVKEANRLNIPVIGILDTNCDPDVVQYPIPGNDDAIRSSTLLTRIIADACADGLMLRASRTADDELREQAEAASAPATTRTRASRRPPGSSSSSVRRPPSRRRVPLRRTSPRRRCPSSPTTSSTTSLSPTSTAPPLSGSTAARQPHGRTAAA
jgi:hypothetical protein